MRWFLPSKLNLITGLLASIYIIEEVKKADAYCGGDTKVATLNHLCDFTLLSQPIIQSPKIGEIVFQPQGFINTIASEINTFDAKAKAEWADKMKSALEEWADKTNHPNA